MLSLRRMGTTLALALIGSATVQAEPVRIRMAWVAPVSNWGSILLEKKDLAKNHGKTYTMEAVRFAGTPPMITALANNELEVSNLAYSTLGLAIQNAGLTDLRVIADEFQDGVDDYQTTAFFVLKDGPIQKVADLKGKIVATNAAGSAVDIAMRAMLRKSGLEDKRDFTMVEAPFPTMRAMLTEKKVDLIPGVLPFSLDPEFQRVARPLVTQKEVLGTTQMIVWAVRKGFIDKNRAAMVDFMTDVLTIVRWYKDPANKDEVMQIASRVTKQPAERFSWLFTKVDYFRDPLMRPNVAALQSNIDLTQELGFIRNKLEIKDYVDVSLVEEAAKRLK